MDTRKLVKSQKMVKFIAKGMTKEPAMYLQPFEVMIVENKNIVHLQNNNLVPLRGTEKYLDKAYNKPSMSFLQFFIHDNISYVIHTQLLKHLLNWDFIGIHHDSLFI